MATRCRKVFQLALALIVVGLLLWSFRTPRRPSPRLTPQEPLATNTLAAKHVPSQCGSLAGRVRWQGPIPVIEPFTLAASGYTPRDQPPKPNPNRIVVHDEGLQDCVVYLRQVDVARAKPWDHADVTVEAVDLDLFVTQGSRRRIGFVERGQEITMVAREAKLHSVRATGAMFFTQMLTDIDQPIRRPTTTTGVVEFTSGNEFVWARAYLFVVEHPYYTLTDERGRYQFDRVPDGDYELVCWKPNWHIAQRDRDPEFAVHTRLKYHPPVEQRRAVRVVAGQGGAVDDVVFEASLFTPR